MSRMFGWAAAAVAGATLCWASQAGAQTAPLPSVRLAQGVLVAPSSAGASSAAPAAIPRDVRIQSLARGLQRDPDQIYAYVRDAIEFEPMFGLHKGSAGVWEDKSGGAFDIAALVVDLLRESGVPTRYVYGTVSMGPEAAGVFKASNAHQLCQLLANSGTPATVNGASDCASVSGAVGSVQFAHVWAEGDVGGTTFSFDPALKQHVQVAGVDLWAAMGTSASAAWSQMSAGAVTSGTQLSGFNPANAEQAAQSASLALLGQVNGTGLKDKSVRQITGGWAPSEVLATKSVGLPYVSQIYARWDGEVPSAFRASLRIQAYGFDQTFDLAELYAQRVQLQAQDIYSPGTSSGSTNFKVYIRRCQGLQTGRETCQDEFNGDQFAFGQWDGKVRLTIDHPYTAAGGHFMDETIDRYLYGGERNELVLFVGSSDGNRMGLRKKATDRFLPRNTVHAAQRCETIDQNDQGYHCFAVLAEDEFEDGHTPSYQDNGYPGAINGPFSRDETALSEMAQNKDHLAQLWWAQTSLFAPKFEALSQTRLTHHHSLGIVTNSALMMDVDTAVGVADAGNYTPAQAVSGLSAFLSAFEGSAVWQMYSARRGGDGHGTQDSYFTNEVHPDSRLRISLGMTTVLDPLRAGGAVTVLPAGAASGLLPANAPPDLIARAATYLASGYGVTMPNDGLGKGFLASRPDGAGVAWIVSDLRYPYAQNPTWQFAMGYRKGAVSAFPDPTGYLGDAQKGLPQAGIGLGSQISLRDGTLTLSEPADVKVGTGDFPESLSFVRSYSSGGYGNGGGLGTGWTHSFASSVSADIDYLSWLNGSNPQAEASTLAAAQLVLEASRHADITGSLATAAVADWWWRTSAGRAYNFQVGTSSDQFLQLANGVWRSPSSPSSRLEVNSHLEQFYQYQSFTRTLADGSVQFFDNTASLRPPTRDTYPKHDVQALQSWTFPNRIRVTFAYATTPDNHNAVTRVSNSLGRSIDISINSFLECESSLEYVSHCTSRSANSGALAAVLVTGRPDTTVTYTNDGFCGGPSTLCIRAVTSVSIPGKRVRRYTYPQDDPASLFGGFSLLTSITEDGVVAPRAHFTYEGVGLLLAPHVISMQDGLGRITNYYTTGDAKGAMTTPGGATSSVEFDSYGRETRSVDPLGRASTRTYDGRGRLLKVTSPEGNSSERTYDLRDNLLSETAHAKPSSGLADLATSKTYLEGELVLDCVKLVTCNKPASETDARSNITRFSWDEQTGLLTQTLQPPDSDGVSLQVDYAYKTYTGVDGATFYVPASRTEKVISGQSLVTTYDYDNTNKYVLKSVTVDPTGKNIRTCYRFDVLGRLASVTDPRATACP